MFGWGTAGLALATVLGFWVLAALSTRFLRIYYFGLISYRLISIKVVMSNVGLLLSSLAMAVILQADFDGLFFGSWGRSRILFLVLSAIARLKVRWMSELTKRMFAVESREYVSIALR